MGNSMTPEEQTAATRAGRLASANGEPRTVNPYYANTPLWRAWNAAYDDRPSLFNRIMTGVVGWFTRRERE